MLPKPPESKLVSAWLALMIAASLTSALDGGWLASWLALEPRRIFHGELWRLATWPLIECRLVVGVMTCLAIYKLGGELTTTWGDARLRRYMLIMILLGGIATSLVSLVIGDATIWLRGGFGVMTALGIAWVREFPHATLSFWSIEARGAARIPLVVALNVMLALLLGRQMAPSLAICAGAMLYPRGA